jgi:hypothetical protein
MYPFERGPHTALNRAILTACLPGGGILPHLLDGTPKSLVAFWCGGEQGDPDSYDEVRGDGHIVLQRPGADFYITPWFAGEDHNIRAGIPLVLLQNPPCARPQAGPVLALGLLHPLFASATVEIYHRVTGEAQERLYLVDPRAHIDHSGRLLPAAMLSPDRRATQPDAAEWPTATEQQSRLREMGCGALNLPPTAPVLA